MEYQKIIFFLDNASSPQSKLKTKNWIEINDKLWRTYSKYNQIRFKTSVLRSVLCFYSDTYFLLKGAVTVAPATAAAENNAIKKVIFRNCAPFTSCISIINNTQVDNAHDFDIVVPIVQKHLEF